MDAAVRDWGASGLAYLTGYRSGPPDFSRAAVLSQARTIAGQYRDRTGVDVDAGTLLAGRAGMLGLSRDGRRSPGGGATLFKVQDGWCALTLSRPDDVDAVAALLECAEPPNDPWFGIVRWARTRLASDVAGRARLLGLPVAVLGERGAEAPVARRVDSPVVPRGVSGRLVVDLSSMWAGPLCGHLLAMAGADVVKVESLARPDGTRAGPGVFFDWINGGKRSYVADFHDVGRLHALLAVADVVIEASRPDALRRRGLGANDVPARPGRVWVRITGHGAEGERANWVAFGDDAAVAGGLVGRAAHGPVFCADAIADPLTGLHAALAATESLARGGGELIDVSLAGIAASYAGLPLCHTESHVLAAVPSAPPTSDPGPALGADNVWVERLIDARSPTPC